MISLYLYVFKRGFNRDRLDWLVEEGMKKRGLINVRVSVVVYVGLVC